MSDPYDRLKAALAQTVRALAGSDQLDVKFTPDPSTQDGLSYSDTVRLPPITARSTEDDLRYIRGLADSIGLHKRFHNHDTYTHYQPIGPEAQAIYSALETARIECLGSRIMRGVAKNLQHKFEVDQAKAPQTEADKAAKEISAQLRQMALSGLSSDAPIEELSHLLSDQQAFAKATRDVLTKMGYGDQLGSDPDQADADTQGTDSPEDTPDQTAQDTPETQENSTQQPPAETDMQSTLQESDETMTPLQASLARLEMEADQATTATDLQTPIDPEEMDAEEQSHHVSEASPGYVVFSTEYDETLPAETLSDLAELSRLRGYLDQQLEPYKGTVAKLANRLQRQLMARQKRRWLFDQEEGLLDASRLARVIANPLVPLSFKVEQETDFKDTVVTLLIDNSGSMRGRPISIAAMCADVLARTLERCEVKTEILGFTTCAWKGGQSRQVWVNEGTPEGPGRLNDIRHIIYKGADTPWRRARKNLGLMMREGLLKENIDGEALEWAYARLCRRPEQRRILMVISDGAPVDDSTLSVNAANYLECHLRDVIHMIETRKVVELCAIGIGHDVTRYYSKAITISDAEQLAGKMIAQLADLFGT